jgi:hypothetical protein
MKKPKKRPATLCMAPWTHSYISPQSERRMCCASKEPAQCFEQYIDSKPGTGKYIPITLDKHWNSDHMRSVRKRMMNGETLPECEVCDNKLLNTDVYRSYFQRLFENKYSSIWETTNDKGYTTLKPVSWDYRFSNLCNFKCRMCGDMLSSAWETEERQHNMIDWSNPKNNWMRPDIRKQIKNFQQDQVEQEFAQAVEEHRVEEVYWVGGEPLMYEQHWQYMRRIIELNDGHKVYARYNTNLSTVEYRGLNLYDDILCYLRDWQICASLDGTEEIGEYIRTGLDYSRWLENFTQGIKTANNSRQLRIDFTLTLPGLFEVKKISDLSRKLGVGLLSKVCFAFTPDIVMSPMCLPRPILNNWLDKTIPTLKDAPSSLLDVLHFMYKRPTFQEQWPDEYEEGLIKGKKRLLQLEKIRGDSKITIDTILEEDTEIYEWWASIDC